MNTIEIEDQKTKIELSSKHSIGDVSLFIKTFEEDPKNPDKEIETKIRVEITLNKCQTLITVLKRVMKDVVDNA